MSRSTRKAWREQERRLQAVCEQHWTDGVPQDDPRSLAAYAQLEPHHDNQSVLDRVGQVVDRLRGQRFVLAAAGRYTRRRRVPATHSVGW